MVKVEYALIKFEHRTEILISLCLHRRNQVLALFSTQQQAVFFKDAFMNAGYTSIDTQTFEQHISQDDKQSKHSCTVIMDIPTRFQTLSQLVKHASAKNSQILILICKQDKKYINFVSKKVEGCEFSEMQYSPKKFTDFNYKLKQMVQQNYDLNRQAFYAYGSFLNNFRQNLLKTIFKTESIDVHALAKSFGFQVAPRVKQGKFCNQAKRIKINAQQRALRHQKKKEKKALKRKEIQDQQKRKTNLKGGNKQEKATSKKVVKTKRIKKA